MCEIPLKTWLKMDVAFFKEYFGSLISDLKFDLFLYVRSTFFRKLVWSMMLSSEVNTVSEVWSRSAISFSSFTRNTFSIHGELVG